MKLSAEQKKTFYRDGFVVVPGLVPSSQIKAARKQINRSFGQGIDPARMTEFRAQTFCPELRGDPIIWDLLRANATFDVVEELVGKGAIDPNNLSPQIATRFPELTDEVKEIHAHLDGMYTPDNAVNFGEIRSHTLLVGVFLSDVNEENAGNFTAWPGSHHIYEKYFREHGPDSLLNGMPKIDIGEPKQLLVKEGDVLLAHYQLAHCVGAHIGSDIRYTVFFRVRHPQHEVQKLEAMTNIWLEWPGMAEIIDNI